MTPGQFEQFKAELHAFEQTPGYDVDRRIDAVEMIRHPFVEDATELEGALVAFRDLKRHPLVLKINRGKRQQFLLGEILAHLRTGHPPPWVLSASRSRRDQLRDAVFAYESCERIVLTKEGIMCIATLFWIALAACATVFGSEEQTAPAAADPGVYAETDAGTVALTKTLGGIEIAGAMPTSIRTRAFVFPISNLDGVPVAVDVSGNGGRPGRGRRPDAFHGGRKRSRA